MVDDLDAIGIKLSTNLIYQPRQAPPPKEGTTHDTGKPHEHLERMIRQAEEKLKEAENTQILADVNALNLSPEQLAEFLKLVASGKPLTNTHELAVKHNANNNDPDEDEYDESEDTEDEEN